MPVYFVISKVLPILLNGMLYQCKQEGAGLTVDSSLPIHQSTFSCTAEDFDA